MAFVPPCFHGKWDIHVCNSKSPVARGLWFLDHKSMATGLLLL